MKIRLMLADDNALYREALRDFLEIDENFQVVAEVADGLAVLQQYALIRPDVVLMDIGMPALNGMETTRRLLVTEPGARVIGLSGHADWPRVAAMIDAGALGYVIKGAAAAVLREAIRKASQNESYFDPALGIKNLTDLVPLLRRIAPQ
jgi:DNA-binding NarL/FixJ family response regulator